jgi:hypothetical protein
MSAWVYRQDQEVPSFAVNWYDSASALIDFSTGYTFQVLLVTQAGVITVTKTANITGAATAPNVTVAWAAGELNITPGEYLLHLKATTGTSDRIFSPGRLPTITITATPT